MIAHLRELYTYRSLLFAFVLRDYKARYKHTSLGIAWAIIQPLFLMFVFTLVFSIFFKVNTGGVPYPVFSYVALLPWTFISKAFSVSGQKFISSRGLITKIYFPREIIPLSVVLSNLIDFGFGTLVFILMFIYYRIPLSPSLVFLLVLFPMQILLATGLSLLGSVLSALFRDLEFAMPLFIQIWMYASPVIYSVRNLQSRFHLFFYFNPVTGIIDGFRDAIILGRVPDLRYLATSFVISVFIFFFGYWMFKRLEYVLVDIL
ncbi:MAG: hypothetical protein A3F04_02025 [Candidatus Chisholmbacteria bacterium RIFCSPHIGHO2_12_FULL_49_9]|uniref:Transport permease protein n=1 Tax=Candidatus Chisholmbacteria bacterium RIFCSPHIGHO2_01_FULL_52_32 TaxID=1797591 RepID=A0A1G1VTH0_9BACT|nr:MAG: hypothetical protein A2786_03295 [Candidatus Chisholmbacteria bacterium RIFCSPHIGHO2_01_FULL_52_32]OGY19211.1 MAG: hypothetical protein A3F04_02025 [Candidatus Chisholmbacteria bacterium RIFCSPHIGHO2_12_FULL_49_9]OGY20132.1 MAG: hypothetical protein A2900_03450 [Candidatus Chisholmbacteria bacterium RIFCSPLOWO2_01_FULL_50_28]